jgi:hypothetical protein
MRKWLLAGASAGVLAGVGLAVLLTTSTASARKQAGLDEPQSVHLPIRRVVLFSSGVGHFQREGKVTGDARIDLSFPETDINDLIKSMVVRDHDGGHITAVSYDSQAPIERTLKSFAVDLTANPTLDNILNQARGERVEVVPLNAAGAGGTLAGTVVGVEKQKVPAGNGKDTIETAVLNLWCTDGLRAIKMAEVQRIKFLNPVLESEFRKALETLALSHDTQKKAVSIRAQGEGQRQVSISYVVENPVWKTSYRLVLSNAEEKKAPYLQGWAVVENTTDEDWRDVRMALVSGRPISFEMDLYQPMFIKRPIAQLEKFSSLGPVAYSGGLDAKDRAVAENRTRDAVPRPGPMAPTMAGMPGGFGGRAANSAMEKAKSDTYRRQLAAEMGESMDLNAGVTSSAMATQLGDFFQYLIDKPVSLPRQKSALLPILGGEIEATRLSIYNERVQPKFPLLGLRVKNTSGAHLMQGPLTIFEGSTYAGDAIIRDLQPNEERLLSYAVDLGTEVNPVVGTDSGKYLTLKAVNGVLHTTSKTKRTKTYQIRNRSTEDRVVLVEHPVDNNFKLVGEKPKETASDFYRFEVPVPKDGKQDFVVVEEREERQQFQISNESDDRIRWFSTQPITSPKVKQGLEQALQLRRASSEAQRELGEAQRQLKVITDDQTRLRANLAATPTTAAVYKKWLKKLDDQEEIIEKLQEKVEKLAGDLTSKQKAFDAFLANFSAE